MPPKPKPGAKSGGGTSTAVEEDLSDVATLPQLNEFIFATFYAFKYKKNKDRLEQMLLKRFNVPAEGETAEKAKTNKVVQLADLLNQAKAKSYLTEAEADDLTKVDPLKVRQVLARTTNEILASITVPLRRLKAEEVEKFKERLEKIEDEEEKKVAQDEQTKLEWEKGVELSVWLKDFPRTAEDWPASSGNIRALCWYQKIALCHVSFCAFIIR